MIADCQRVNASRPLPAEHPPPTGSRNGPLRATETTQPIAVTDAAVIVRLRRSQWAALRRPAAPPNPPSHPTSTDRKALTVRIRLHGTPAETTAALDAIARALHICPLSRPYPDHRSPMFQRIYLDATPKENTR